VKTKTKQKFSSQKAIVDFSFENSQLFLDGDDVSLCLPRSCSLSLSRVARRFVFKPKIPIWVNFEGL
jgi:hypothetical protein